MVAEVAAAVPVASWLGDPVQALRLAITACCQMVEVPCICDDGEDAMGYLECLPEHQRSHSRLQKASSAVQASFITYQQCPCWGNLALACARWRECCRDPCRASSMHLASVGCQRSKAQEARSMWCTVSAGLRLEATWNKDACSVGEQEVQLGCVSAGITQGGPCTHGPTVHRQRAQLRSCSSSLHTPQQHEFLAVTANQTSSKEISYKPLKAKSQRSSGTK